MPIALLNFPTDLLGEVFKLCNPFELYFLSKCSKRARSCVKLGGTKHWKIGCCCCSTVSIECEDNMIYDFLQTKEPNYYYDTAFLNNYIEIPEGIGELLAYLLDTFGIRTVKWLKNKGRDLHSFLQIPKILIDRNMEVEELWLDGFGNEDSIVNIMPVINQMNITREFECLVRPRSDFQNHFTRYPKRIEFRYSFWFTIDQLLDCTCAHIELFKSNLNNQDINMFLEKWKRAGTFPNLQYLSIDSKRIDKNSSILDMVLPIKNTENPSKAVTAIFRGNHRTHCISVDNGVKVVKEDGTEGWLKVELNSWRQFQFVVRNPDDVEQEFENEEWDDEEPDDIGSDDEN
ncbi:hypothetical protein B9Z55_003692 [Caenorhabditis nigoni]|uniref:F-box domain-containing protein n=1 Tax=Caenorhabditis nigoni TaxID=1611254 RepID=A0A2G5VRJ4_9PELO|nr:hypothetical protein B9Z55_003692 [Caenorhabditis nigoni]